MLLPLTSQPLLPGLFQLPPYGLSNSILSLMPSHLPGPGLFLPIYSLPCKHISRASPQSKTKTPKQLTASNLQSKIQSSWCFSRICFTLSFHNTVPHQPSSPAKSIHYCRASISHHVHPPSTPWLTSSPPKCSKPQSPEHSLPSKLKYQFLLMPSLTRRSSPDKCFLYISLVLP